MKFPTNILSTSVRGKKVFLKVSQQASWQLLGKVVTSLSTFIILGLVSRTYGETNTGIFTLALTYLAFFYLISDFGINAHIIPRLLEDNITVEWRKLLGLRVLLSLLLFLVAVAGVLIWPVDQTFRNAVVFGSLAIFGSSVYTTAAAIFQSKLRYDLSAASILMGALVPLPLFMVLVNNHYSIVYLMLAHMLGWLIFGTTALISIRKYIKSFLPIFDSHYIKKIILEVWPITATLILNTIYFRLDAFLLTSLRSFSDVGVYNLSYSIFQSALVVPTFIMNGYYPLMLRNFAENKDMFISNLKKTCLVMFTIAISGTLLTLILSPLVVNLLTGGKGFSGSSESLQILSLGFPAFFVSSVLMWTLVVTKKYKTMMLIYILGLVVNLVLNLILIPHFSYFGSSTATVISEYFIVTVQAIVLFKILSRNISKISGNLSSVPLA